MLPERVSPLVRGWDGASASYQRYLTVPPAAGSSSRRPSVLDSIPGSPQPRRPSLTGSVVSQASRRDSLRRPSLLDAGAGSPARYARRRSSLRRSSLGPGGRARRRSLTPAERWRLLAAPRSTLLTPRHYHMSCDFWSSDEESGFEPAPPATAYRDEIRRMSVELGNLELGQDARLGSLEVLPAIVEPPQVSRLS